MFTNIKKPFVRFRRYVFSAMVLCCLLLFYSRAVAATDTEKEKLPNVVYFPDIMPTIAELAGLEPAAGTDGISILPELIGAAAGHSQLQHDFLYWEYKGGQAVRKGNQQAISSSEFL